MAQAGTMINRRNFSQPSYRDRQTCRQGGIPTDDAIAFFIRGTAMPSVGAIE